MIISVEMFIRKCDIYSINFDEGLLNWNIVVKICAFDHLPSGLEV